MRVVAGRVGPLVESEEMGIRSVRPHRRLAVMGFAVDTAALGAEEAIAAVDAGETVKAVFVRKGV